MLCVRYRNKSYRVTLRGWLRCILVTSSSATILPPHIQLGSSIPIVLSDWFRHGIILSTGYKTLRTRVEWVQSVVRGWCERTMFSSKYSADEMLLRSEQSISPARFPLNLIRRTYNQIFNPRDISSYYHHLALLAEAPQPPPPLQAQIRTEPRRDECSDRVECIPSPKVLDLDYGDWTKSEWMWILIDSG